MFLEVDRPNRIPFESRLHIVDDGRTLRTHVSITFEELYRKTLLTIVQTGFERAEDRDGIEGGWPSILSVLERVVMDRREGIG